MPFQLKEASFMNNNTAGNALLFTLVYKPMHKLVSTQVIVGAYRAYTFCQ
jgi:hypothetical protein